MQELHETINPMMSTDYKERFKAQYYQLKIRRDELAEMLKKWDAGDVNFNPTCPRELYDEQFAAMNNYLSCLKERAELEEIEVD